jgi:hypothetical protein
MRKAAIPAPSPTNLASELARGLTGPVRRKSRCLLAPMTLLASYVPVRRALTVDPVDDEAGGITANGYSIA